MSASNLSHAMSDLTLNMTKRGREYISFDDLTGCLQNTKTAFTVQDFGLDASGNILAIENGKISTKILIDWVDRIVFANKEYEEIKDDAPLDTVKITTELTVILKRWEDLF